MTEHQIYKLLSKNNEQCDNFDFLNLQSQAVNSISKNLTKIIYESLSQKSSASSSRRHNILKFINATCSVKDTHLNKSTDKCSDLIQKSFKSPDDEDLARFKSSCMEEMKSRIHNDLLSGQLNKFYKLKNSKRLKKLKFLELIKEKEQKHLDTKFGLHVRKNISYYNSNDDVMMKFLAADTTDKHKNNNVDSTTGHRKNLIKLAYATMNLSKSRESKEFIVLEKILHKLSYYHTTLEGYEQNFLKYLWDTDGEIIFRYLESFFFLLEHIILKHSVQVLSLTNESDVCDYFVNLEDHTCIIKIRNICKKNNIIYLKLKSLLFNLYFQSFCNKNVLKMCDLII